MSDRRYTLDLVSFVLREEESKMKQEISGKHVGMIFDGTTHHGGALAIDLRYGQ